MIGEANTLFYFGEFELDADRRVLLRGSEVVPLKGKAFDLLLTFVERRGEILSKNELLDKLWENQFVEENNLTVHVAAVRKALGEKKNENRFVVTVPGKGYRFVADVPRPVNRDVIIESRKFRKFVVNEELEEITEANGRDAAADSIVLDVTAAERRTRFSRVLILTSVITSLAVVAVLGAYMLRDKINPGYVGGDVPFKDHTVVQLTTNGKVGSAALSPDGKLFAYVIEDVGLKSLWLGKVDGGNHIELRPPGPVTYRSITFSPDGNDLYYTLRDDKNTEFSVYRMPAFGGTQTRLFANVEDFALAPDGRRVAIARSDNKLGTDVIAVERLDGSESYGVASFPKELTFRSDSISWSRDGTRIAVSAAMDTEPARHEIAVVELETRSVTRIASGAFREITKTVWLDDGSGLIVTAIEPDSNSSVPQYRLYHVAYPSGEYHNITADRSNYGESWHSRAGVSLSLSNGSDSMLAVEHRQLTNVWIAPANDLAAAQQITFGSFGKYDGLWGLDWTPVGRLIYTTSDTQHQFLSEMNIDGSGQKPITEPRGYDSVLTVSPNGRHIFFHSDRRSTIDIWRTDIDGSNPIQLTFGGKGLHPAPSADGRWVYYKSNLKGDGRLCRVAIDGGDPECLNDKETSWMSFSPDGKYFAASLITDKQRLAIYSAETNELIRQFDLPDSGTMYMGTRWTADSKAVTFRDNSFGYWNQPINGGEPVRLEGLPKEKLYNFSWSRDGKWLAFVRGQEIRDVVLFRRTNKE